MHIPDGFLDPKISAGMMGAAATALVPSRALAAAGKGMNAIAGGYRRVLTKLGERKIYQMGMIASLVFAAQMFNFPIDQGTSGHLIGGVLAAALLGPFAGTIVIAEALITVALVYLYRSMVPAESED